jgi:hypothetical protein
MLQESGISKEEAKALMYDAVREGDLSKIDRAGLEAKVGKNAANIILTGTQSYVNEAQAKVQVTMKAVHDQAGGSENWDKVSGWASTNVSEADLAEYRPMIDKGGAAARFAVSEIMGKYNADAANTSINPSTPRAEPSAIVPPASTAITRAEYVAALAKANLRGRPDPKVIATIQAQRNAGRAKGI